MKTREWRERATEKIKKKYKLDVEGSKKNELRAGVEVTK